MWKVDKPKNDDVYFERMSKAIFSAGLSWRMINNKWPEFRKAFEDFSLVKVAKFGESDVMSLMSNAKIVRNEKKIRATIFNAQEALRLEKEFGSFDRYIASFHGAYNGTANDISERFRFIGPSTARTFLWMAGVKLTPTEEEKAWIARHDAAKKRH